jgi:hypothetical protein
MTIALSPLPRSPRGQCGTAVRTAVAPSATARSSPPPKQQPLPPLGSRFWILAGALSDDEEDEVSSSPLPSYCCSPRSAPNHTERFPLPGARFGSSSGGSTPFQGEHGVRSGGKGSRFGQCGRSGTGRSVAGLFSKPPPVPAASAPRQEVRSSAPPQVPRVSPHRVMPSLSSSTSVPPVRPAAAAPPPEPRAGPDLTPMAVNAAPSTGPSAAQCPVASSDEAHGPPPVRCWVGSHFRHRHKWH